MSYTVPPYSAPSALSMLHSSPRVQGSNVFNFPTDGFALSQDDPTVQYMIGVAVGPMVGVILFFIWMFSLCCISCCRQKCCPNRSSNKIGGVFFVGFMVLSCFGWFYSLGANTQAINGINTIMDTGNDLSDFVDTAEATLDAVVTTVNGVLDTVDTATATCYNLTETANVSIPEADWTEFSSEIDESVDGITAPLRDVITEYNEAFDMVEPYLAKARLGYTVAVSLIIVLSGIFTIATLYRLWANAPGRNSRPAKVLASCSGTTFVVLSVLVLLLLWIVIFVLGIIATVGADFCVPDPSTNLNRLLDQVLSDPGAGEICDQEPYSYLCYYQTCEGSNPLDTGLFNVSDVTDEFQTSIAQLADELNQTAAEFEGYGYPLPNATECILAIDSISDSIDNIPSSIDDVINLGECENINPMYRKMIETGMCNQVTTGFAVMWITLMLGSVSLMAAILVYKCFEFDRYEDGHFATAQAVAVGDQDKQI